MKYRGDHLGNKSNFNRSGGGGGAYHFSSGHNHQRPNNGSSSNGPERKSNRAYIGESGGGGTVGQVQIELVDKVLNQISMHQSISSSKPANSGKSANPRIRAMGGDSRLGRANSYAKKSQSQHYNNSNYQISGGGGGGGVGGRYKNSSSSKFNANTSVANSSSTYANFKAPKDRSFVSGSCGGAALEGRIKPNGGASDNIQCSQCEYVFVDGQLLPKFECTHKPPLPKATSGGAKSNRPPPNAAGTRSRTRSRQHQAHPADKFGHKGSSSSKAYVNRNKKDNAHNHQQALLRAQNFNGAAIKSALGIRQSIISNLRSEDMKKFVEAQIVFDSNIIDVVPVQNDICSFKLLSSASSILTKSEPPPSEQMKSNLSQKQVSTKPIEIVESFTLPSPIPMEAAQFEHSKTFDEAIVFASQPSSPLASTTPLHSQLNSTPKSVDQEMAEVDWDYNKAETLSSNVQPQPAKKVRCLIANFITIQVEDEISDEGNNQQCASDGEAFVGTSAEILQEDILKEIDCEKLGFQNFDGKNIGLYKNIGYINRNKAKFARPTEELLQLILSPKVTSQAAQPSFDVAVPVNSELDLTPFYDLQSPGSYEKEYAYSVLESLINDDGQLISQIKARKYRYPEYDYSSECEDPIFMSTGNEQQQLQQQQHLNNKSKNSNSAATSSLSAFHLVESDNDQMDSISSGNNNNNSGKYTMTRYINNSALYGGGGGACGGRGASSSSASFETRYDKQTPSSSSSINTTDPISEEAMSSIISEDSLLAELYGSYYITEVSFSVN